MKIRLYKVPNELITEVLQMFEQYGVKAIKLGQDGIYVVYDPSEEVDVLRWMQKYEKAEDLGILSDDELQELKRRVSFIEANENEEFFNNVKERIEVKLLPGKYMIAHYLHGAHKWVEDGQYKTDEEEIGTIFSDLGDEVVVRIGLDCFIFIDKPKEEKSEQTIKQS